MNNLEEFINMNDFQNVCFVNNNISLVEDLHEFLGNKVNGDEKSLYEELDYESNNKILKHNNKLEVLNNSLEEIDFYDNVKQHYIKKYCRFEFEKKEIVNINENKFWTEQNADISFEKNNLSEIVDEFVQKNSDNHEEDVSITISKKKTQDCSKTNESNYTSMKFTEDLYKNGYK